MLTKPIFLTTSFLFRFCLLLALITVNFFTVTRYQLISLLAGFAILHTNFRQKILQIDAKIQSATTKVILVGLFAVAYLLNFLPAMLLHGILQRRGPELFTSTEFDFNSPYRVRKE